MLKTRLFHDYAFVSQIGDEFKVVCMNAFPNPAYADRRFTKKGEAGNEEKLADNLRRSRNSIIGLALCNDWEFFTTLTIDGQKRDRMDLNGFHKDLSEMITNLNRTVAHSEKKIRYLLIPELHKDGACHMHGFLMGLLPEELHLFSAKEHLPYKILNRIKAGKKVYSWIDYSSHFGFSDLEYIESRKGSAGYMTKYIEKDMIYTVKELGAHTYYCSRGLNRPVTIHEGFLARSPTNIEYENEHVKVAFYKSLDEIRELFEDSGSL